MFWGRLKEQKTIVLMLIILNILLPSCDVYFDIALAWKAASNYHPKFAGALIAPVLLNMVFTFFTWFKVEDGANKKWSWILVLLQCWPQYMAVKIIVQIATGQEEWKKNKESLQRDVSSLEPYLESTPQVLIQTTILITTEYNEFEDVFGDYDLFLATFSSCSGSGLVISPESSLASSVSISRSFFFRFLNFLAGSVATG